MADLSNVRGDGARLWDSVMDMAKIGATRKAGATPDVDRSRPASPPTFSEFVRRGRRRVKVDEMGNMFARRRGEDDMLAPVMMGSHLGTQPTGGEFEGARSLSDLNLRIRRPRRDSEFGRTHEGLARKPGVEITFPDIDKSTGVTPAPIGRRCFAARLTSRRPSSSSRRAPS